MPRKKHTATVEVRATKEPEQTACRWWLLLQSRKMSVRESSSLDM